MYHVCASCPSMSKKASDPWEIELWMVTSCLVWVLGPNSDVQGEHVVPLTAEPAFQPHFTEDVEKELKTLCNTLFCLSIYSANERLPPVFSMDSNLL